MKSASTVLIVAMLASGCALKASSEAADTAPTISTISVDFETRWTPAWGVPGDVRADLVSVLDQSSLWLLIPTAPPTGRAEESLAGEVRVTSRAPSGIHGADMVVRRGDMSVFVSLQTLPVAGEPLCEAPLNDPEYSGWTRTSVRGAEGCALLVDDAVSYLSWTESGQNLSVDFGPEMDVEDLIAWLASWERLGRA